MGRLVNPNEFINENIERYNERAVSNYSTLLETTPTFATYFHQSRVFTTHDLGLENVEDDIGRDSPVKYEKIELLPLYGADTLSLQIERGDMGLNTNIESELTILANTIKPYAGDFFYLDSLGEKYLFKVTEVQDDLIRTKPIYRISFRLSKIQDEKSYKEIEEQVIESYTTIFNNIGTDNECIVKSSVFRAIDKINKITDKLNKVFIRNFYDELFNVMRFRINTLDTEIYNRYLNKFLIDNEILKESNERSSFYSTVKLVEYLPTDSTFDAVYEKTIYYAVESQSVKQFFDRMFSFIDVNYNHAPWFRSNKDYKDFVPLTDDEEVQNEHIMDFIDKEFYGRIKINQPYNNENDYFMENLIIRYINGDNSLPDEKLLDMINENIWRADMRSYIFIPIINFILRRLIRDETIKQL